MRLFWKRAMLVTALAVTPAAAGAQSIFVSPFIGGTFAGGETAKDGAPTAGLAAGWRGTGWWGLEGDVAATPGFFTQDGFRTERRAMTATANLIFGMPSSDRPFSIHATAGAGAMSLRLSEPGGLASIDVTEPALSAGGGVVWMKNGKGVRADVRYLRAMGDEADDANAFGLEVSKTHFVRATVGIVLGF